jgi:ribosomal protein L37E
MTKLRDPDYDDREHADKLVERPEIETFRIGQGYEKTAAVTLSCRDCGGIDFNVGQGSYYTAIKCPRCGWEHCIHDG